MKKQILLTVVFALSMAIYAQTPGLILTDAGTGAAILDPDGDGYISKKTDGVQIGFTNPPNSDVSQSEIPYVPIVTSDPTNDLEQGRACHFSELVGGANPDQYAALMYWDNANSALLFRMRIAAFVANSKAYSVLIDTDQKFGFTGPQADPNALPGNPGFEIEVTLMTNHGVALYNIDGSLIPSLVTELPYANYAQKSVAVSSYCDDPDYFFDFFVPIASLASFGVDENTPLRFAIVTNMNPSPSIGSNSMSDVGGSYPGNSIDEKFINTITAQTPTAPTDVNDGIEERSVCPPINSVYTSSVTISGTSIEADGTSIEVFVYQSDGTTLIGSGTTTTSANAWSIDVVTLSPSVTLEAGQVVKATATAPGKGTSADDCDEKVVDDCINYTNPPVAGEIDIISGNKGYEVTVNRPIGTKIYLYNTDGTLFDVALLKTGATNPIITTAQPQTVKFECQTGQCFVRAIGSSVYRFVFEEPGLCESYEYLSCDYTTGASAIPTITTSPITMATTTIEGTGIAANTQILIYVNGIPLTPVYTSATTPFAFSTSFSGLALGDSITFKQIENGKCYSDPVTVYVTRQAYFPTIATVDCNATYPLTAVSGYSVEAPGSTLTVYKVNPTRTVLGSTTVQANGSWTLSGITLQVGDQITAAITAGTDLTPSIDSDTITFSAQTAITAYTITINAPTEGDTSVSGTISGGAYPLTINVYTEGSYIGTTTASTAGSWEATGIPAYDIATGSEIQVRVIASGECESAASAAVIVLCDYPDPVTITAVTQSFCDGTYGEIIIQNSEAGVYYEPILASDSTTFGYGRMGDGTNITLTTYQIMDTAMISVKASKLPVGTCDAIVADNILFFPGLRPIAPIAPVTQYFCDAGTLADLLVNVPEGTSLKWYDASFGGVELPTSTALVDGITYFVEAICDSNSCTSTNRTPVTAEEGDPLPPTANAQQLVCYESTLLDIDAYPSGPGTVVWYSSASGGTPLPIDTPLETGVTYYAETVFGTCTSATRTAVEVTHGMVTDTTQWTGAVSNEWTNDDNWTDLQPDICTHVVIPDPGNGIFYPVISAPAACKSITFEPGGGVLGLEQLSYERAYVQINLQREKWYTLTAPLKEMYSADYAFEGHPVTWMRLFDQINPDSLYTGGALNIGTWSRGFASANVSLTPGMGFAHLVDDKTYNFPNAITYEMTDQMNYFPREVVPDSLMEIAYPYSTYSGRLLTEYPIYLPRDSFLAYRFAMEDTANVLQDIKVPVQIGLNFVGNPMMCHLDFNALYASNVGVISNKVKFWNGSTFTTYMAGSEIFSSLDLTSTSISPMQAFFVEGLVNDTMLIDLDAHYFVDEVTKLRSTSVPTNIMHIKADNGAKQSSAAIALRSNASNASGDDDAFKLFSQYTDVPEVYSLADEVALDINQFSSLPYIVPIGVKTTQQGPITLTFDGSDTFDSIDVTLLNTLTGEQQNLKANSEYILDFDGEHTDGFLFVEFRSANSTTETDLSEADSCEGNRCIQVYQKDKNTIGIISPPSDKIQNVTIWEKSGMMLYSKYNINRAEIEAKVHSPNQTCVVRVETEHKSYVIKLLFKE